MLGLSRRTFLTRGSLAVAVGSVATAIPGLGSILEAAPAIVPPPDTGYRPEQAAVFYDMCGKILTGKLDLSRAAEYWTREKANLARKGL